MSGRTVKQLHGPETQRISAPKLLMVEGIISESKIYRSNLPEIMYLELAFKSLTEIFFIYTSQNFKLLFLILSS